MSTPAYMTYTKASHQYGLTRAEWLLGFRSTTDEWRATYQPNTRPGPKRRTRELPIHKLARTG